MNPEYEMLFETTMQLFLGDKAYQIAGQAYNEKHRKEWYRKAIRKIIRRIQEIDTSTKHKEAMTHCSERALVILSKKQFNETKLSLYLFCLVGSLLGFAVIGTLPVYLKTFDTEALSKGADTIELMQNYEKNSTSVRKRIINQLREEGLNDFQVSLVLNTSEYQVKKLRRDL